VPSVPLFLRLRFFRTGAAEIFFNPVAGLAGFFYALPTVVIGTATDSTSAKWRIIWEWRVRPKRVFLISTIRASFYHPVLIDHPIDATIPAFL